MIASQPRSSVAAKSQRLKEFRYHRRSSRETSFVNADKGAGTVVFLIRFCHCLLQKVEGQRIFGSLNPLVVIFKNEK